MTYRPKQTHLVVALLVLVVSMLAACFWPFTFVPRNKVTWLTNERGLRFTGLGGIVSREEFPPLSHLSTDGSLTVEVVVRPSRIARNGIPHILSFHTADGPAPLLVGSWKDALLVRLGRTSGAHREKYREIGMSEALQAGRTTSFTVTTGPKGTDLYLNGEVRRSAPDAPFEGNTQALGRLLLGVSPSGHGEWPGDILSLSIYDRALTGEEVRLNHDALEGRGRPAQSAQTALIARYAFSEGAGSVAHSTTGARYDLLIPSVFRPMRREVLVLPSKGYVGSNQAIFQNVILNVVGFIPFGFLAMWVLIPARFSVGLKRATVVLAGFALSLIIELVQVYLPTRSSDVADLATNTLGTAVGVALFSVALAKGTIPPPTSPP